MANDINDGGAGAVALDTRGIRQLVRVQRKVCDLVKERAMSSSDIIG
jgi:hypothetical protein